MNKTAIKNFAIWARNKLIADICYRAGLMGITEKGIADALPQSTREAEFYDFGATEPYMLDGDAIKQRRQLVSAIREKEADTDYATAYQYIMEEVAYTWFNRLIAVRFMEVNDYLPSHLRVLSSESGKVEPDLVTTPFDAELPFTAEEEAQIIQWKQDNKLDELFRFLFIKQCNALNEILPGLFEKTTDYTEVLLNLSVVDQEGVVYKLTHDIPEKDFNIEQGGQVEIIGWLYQYYNTEPKKAAFEKSGKITKEEIPAVTQLFTPDWIVRYMVENSLGRLWLEGHPDSDLRKNWKYYLDEAPQEPQVQAKLAEIRKEYAALNPEDLTLIDPCMGSGHILVYAFDVLMQIYTSVGYSERDAAKSILEHNLYGLDIDDRAYQLAYFAVMMKARQYNRRILNGENTCHVYAPFPKPDVRENHLEDTLLYSRRFFADRASLLSVDLGIEEKYKPILEKHIKFFADKKRTQRFYDLEIENFNEGNILTGLLSAICKARTCSFEEVVRIVLTESSLAENAYLQQFEQYDLLPSFWRLCEQHFGYTDVKPTLERLLVTLFVTYTARYVQAELPAAWKSFVSYKAGNIIAFLDSLMNSVLYRDKYDELSDHVAKGLNVYQAFSGCRADDLVECDTFLAVDQVLVKWLMGRLLAEDTGAKLNELTIPEVCEKRAKMHFGRKTDKTYQLLQSAYCMVQAANYRSAEDFKAIVDRYLSADHQIDQQYRKFYFYYDKLENTETFEPLRELVENIYTNEYLATLLPAWNEGLRQEEALAVLPLQRDFYNANLRYAKERTVVIISDAMRYEVGQELFARMQDDPKCSAQLNVQLGVLPSYTRLGMAALLPHRTLEMTDDFQVLVDGTLCDTLAGRQQVLQSYVPDSVCIQFDEIKSMKVADLRDVLTKRQVIYVYHNQIDARGDKPNTEDEVFNACQEAVQEIMDLIRRINGSGNTHHFIVTADHGFIYKRDKLSESEKIAGKSMENAFVNRRFVVSAAPLQDDGIGHMSMGAVLGNQDAKVVSYPVSSNVFKVAGGGANYVHGGSSPQEMLVPVLDIKMERGHQETKNAEIALVSILHKITNLITSMDFVQSEAVSDTVKPAKYRVFFISEDNEKISNENTYVADNRELSAQKRIFRLRFTFKNKKYDKDKQYYLVVYDEDTGLEQWHHPVMMDIAFADDFGFGF